MKSAEQTVPGTSREDLAPLLLERQRMIAGPVLIGSVAFAVLHVLFGEPRLALLLAMKGGQAVLAAGGMAVSHRFPRRAVIVANLVLLAFVLNLFTAVTGVIIGNVHTNALLFVATTLASAAFLPWGTLAQVVTVAGATACAFVPLLAGSPVQSGFWYDIATLAVAFAISIYIAREVEAHTLRGYRAQALVQAVADRRADFEALFRSSNVMLTIMRLDGDDFVYDEVNDTLADLFGFTPATMRGKRGRDLGFSEEEVARWCSFLSECARTGSGYIAEYHLELVDPPRWFHVSFSAIEGEVGPTARFCGVGVDITQLRLTSDTVQRLNQDLEAQVRSRTALLEAANTDLESFAYSVSHDLRTPLRSIEGFAALLADDHGAEMSAVAAGHFERIRGASRHMAQLIDDLLMLSRAARVEMRRELVDVTVLARDVAAELRGASPGREVHVQVDPGMTAWADPRLLRIVVANLLDNAWKYTSQVRDARIDVGCELREGRTTFYVRDNGCGFDMRFASKLFQPFQRLHAVEEYAGTGIGLATVGRIVRRHGGTVAAVGEPGRGATFSFSLGSTGAGSGVWSI